MPGQLEPFPVRLGVYLRWVLILTPTFAIVYGGTNWWTSQRETRLHLYGEWELAIPLLPEALLIYISIHVLFLLPLWALNSARMACLGRAMLSATLAAGLVFLLLPAQLGYSRVEPRSWLNPVYELLYLLDRPHNLVPSLHVVLSTLVLLFLARDAGKRLRFVYGLWWLLMSASVVLTHQHHLLDVAAGLALGLACYGCFDDGRWLPKSARDLRA